MLKTGQRQNPFRKQPPLSWVKTGSSWSRYQSLCFKAFFSRAMPSFCCGASLASEQQHSQDLKRILKGSTNSRIHNFLPECITFNQSALRHLSLECTASRTTRRCHTIFSCGFQWERFNGGYVLLWNRIACKKCEGDRAWLSQVFRVFLMQYVKFVSPYDCDVLVLNLISMSFLSRSLASPWCKSSLRKLVA